MENQQEREQTEHTEREIEATRAKPPRRRRKRRRWLKAILIVTAMLILLIMFAPWLLSTGAGTSLILSFVNRGIRGRAEVADLSLSWFGPIKAKGVRLLDPTGREVLKADRVAVEIGVWRAIRASERFQQMTVESPRVVLYEKGDGTFSFLEAIGAKKVKPKRAVPPTRKREGPGEAVPSRPKRERPKKALPPLRGKVILRDGDVRIVRADGQELAVRELEGAFDIRSLNNIGGRLQLALAEGGSLELEMQLRDLLRDGRFSPAATAGKVKLRTPKEVELGPVLDMAGGKAKTAGQVNLSLDVNVQPGKASLQFDTNIKKLSTRGIGQAEVRPMSLASNGKVDVRISSAGLDQIAGDVNLTGEGVQLATNLTYQNSQRQPAPALDDILEAALEGKTIKLPQASLRANGQVDLARLAQAIPALMNVRNDVRITGGNILVDRIAIDGGAQPRASGSLRLTELSAIQTSPSTDREETIEWEPITVVFDASLVENEGLQLKTAKLESDFATIHGQGTPKRMDLRLDADLAALFEQEGKLELTAQVQRVDSAISFQSSGKVSGLSIEAKDTRFATDSLALNANGRFHPKDKTLSGRVELDASQSLATLAGKGDKKDNVGTGPIHLEADVARDSADGPYASEGRATVGSPVLNGQPLVDKGLALSWLGVKFSPKERSLAATEVKLDGQDLLKLSATGTSARLGENPKVEGKFEFSVELAKLARAVQPFTKSRKAPAIAGALAWSGQAATTEHLITATGTATVEGLAVGTGEKVFKQGKVLFEHGAAVNLQEDIVTLKEFSLASQPLYLSLSGKIEKFTTDRILDLSGHYKGSWEHLVALLNELAPKVSADTGLAFAGTTESDLRITGPANQPKVQPVFRGVSTNKVRVDWASGQVVGLALGPPVNFQPTMSDGQLILDRITIPASGGSLNLGGMVSFAGESPTLRMPGHTQLIDRVRITPEVGRMLLSRINPIFAQVASLEGELSLSLSDLGLPLGDELMTGGSGSGHLDISNLALKPDGILAALLELSGALSKISNKVSFSGVDFTIKDGRIAYDNFTISFGKEFDLTFRGSVGFDDKLEMWVSVPVGPALLKSFGVKGPLDLHARLLAREKVRLEIPIIGTRLSPGLGKVNIGSLMDSITKGLLEQGVQDIGDLLKTPAFLLKEPGALLKVPAEAVKKPAELLKVPLDIITKPGEVIKRPDTVIEKLRITPQEILVDSLLDIMKKQRESQPGKDQPKR